jgi:hypothetical protein
MAIRQAMEFIAVVEKSGEQDWPSHGVTSIALSQWDYSRLLKVLLVGIGELSK